MPVILLGLAIFLAVIWLFWIGFLGSDDSLYWTAAGGWLLHVPFIGDSHWSLRHTLDIPLALARLAFGNAMTAMVLPTLLYALGLVAVLAWWVHRTCGAAAALIVTLLVATNPQLVLWSSTAAIDAVEVFYVFAALAVMHGAMERGPSWGALLFAGVLAGLGMLSRETTIFAAAAVGLLFLAGYGMERRWYLVVLLGFAAVVLGEMAALWAATGDPFYRSTISLHHDAAIDRWVEQGAAVPIIQPLIDPLTMILFNHDFALLGWIAVPLAIWLPARGGLSGPSRRLAVIVATVSLVWALLAAGLWKQLPLTPRYFMTASIGVSVLAGIALAQLWQIRGLLTLLLGALLLAGNLGAMALDNHNYMFGEHALVALATPEGPVIHTDRETARRAALLLAWKDAADRVATTPPGPGNLFLDNPPRRGPDWRPGPGWTVQERTVPPETLGQRLLGALLPRSSIPSSLWTRLGPGHPGVTLYRLPPA
jgi:hypothetical protein